MMISIRDLAKQNGVTYEAVRQQVKRYADELEGHIHVEGRTQYLDDYAVELLESKRQASPVVVYEANKDEEIARLRDENKNLLLQLNAKNDKIVLLQDQLLEAAKTPLLLAAAQSDLAEAKSKAAEQAEELQRVRAELAGKEQELQQLKEQAAQEQKQEKKPHGWLWRLFFNEEEN